MRSILHHLRNLLDEVPQWRLLLFGIGEPDMMICTRDHLEGGL